MNNHFNKHLTRVIMVALFPVFLLTQCSKTNEWLDAKSSKSDVVPKSLQDFQALLDDKALSQNLSAGGLVGTDNNLITETNLKSVPQAERNMYLWTKDIYQGQSSGDFQVPYKNIEVANIILDGLGKITPDATSQGTYNNIQGQALFLRANMFYMLSQLFCRTYDPITSPTELGLQLRTSSDPNLTFRRATVSETYALMIGDLKTASRLLSRVPAFRTRSSIGAANTLLAKIYLAMEDYTNAALFAEKALLDNNGLLDYNSGVISTLNAYPFPPYSNTSVNPEIIFYASGTNFSSLTAASFGRGNVDPELYNQYSVNDLRRSLFYASDAASNIRIRGTYTGTFNIFSGLATNELYLIYAECMARSGNLPEALKYLNALLEKRYLPGKAPMISATTLDEALSLVLQERRKELPFTGQNRWEDLRRLNRDPRYAKTIMHTYLGITYSLVPGDKRYVFPFPDAELQLSQIPQNDR